VPQQHRHLVDNQTLESRTVGTSVAQTLKGSSDLRLRRKPTGLTNDAAHKTRLFLMRD
jgi:hypothetical protein